MSVGYSGEARTDARLVGALGAVLGVVAVTVWGVVATRATSVPSIPSVPSVNVAYGAFRYSAAMRGGPQGQNSAAMGNSRWQLKFDPSFAGSSLDRAVWDTCYPWTAPGRGCTNHGNAEYEWYLPSQIQVSGGILRLEATKTPVVGRTPQGRAEVFGCRSGMVTSFPGFNFEYGVVQVVAKMSGPLGMWPALWLAASDRRWPPEIDMMEHWMLFRHSTAQYLHPIGAHRISANPLTANLTVGWHTYTLLWTSTELVWFVDGRVTLVTHSYIPHQAMYFVADLADVRNPSSGGCSGSLLLRSVKIWQS